MIITRTPLRISLGGGGTDLPSYYKKRGHGHLVAAAINKYVYVAATKNFSAEIFLRYSQLERTKKVSDVSHPILRECLKLLDIDGGIEITSMADVPSGTGLGSSGSFTVGVLKALSQWSKQTWTNEDLAESACEIEISRLNEPVGKQDQYIASAGGIASITFHADGRVELRQLQMTTGVRAELESSLCLFYTGYQRAALDGLRKEVGILTEPRERKSNLDQMLELGYEAVRQLEIGKLDAFGDLLTSQWKLKFERQPSQVHDQIDDWIRIGCGSGASGGKLVGAGGGGFLLFYATDKYALRNSMARQGLVEIPFRFDYEGSVTLVNDQNE